MKTILHHVLLKEKRFFLLVVSLFVLYFSAGAQTTFSNGDTILIPGVEPIPIPGQPYPSTIEVSRLNGVISNLQVNLYGYEHNNSDAVDILLVAPDGTNAVILSDVGGAKDVYGVNITLDDAAVNQLPDSDPVISGVYKPTNMGFGPDSWNPPAPSSSGQSALSTFYGIDPNGTWSLYVISDTEGAYGKFTGGWSLTITTTMASWAVRFDKFSATYNQPQNKVLLNWTTDYELGSQTFEVERSVPSGNWTSIATIPAAGFTLKSTSYQYTDQNVADGRYMYRIKMVAKDGSVKYSSIEFVNVDTGNSYLIYPNPARDYVNIRPENSQPEKMIVRLTDMNRVVLLRAEGTASKTSPLRFDLSLARPGTYFIIITTSTRETSQVLQVN